MSNKIISLNDSNFASKIQSGTFLVDFWAPWCAPCRIQGQILEQALDKFPKEATIAKVNVDEAPRTAGQYGIQGIPTIMIFKDGKKVQQFVGVSHEGRLVSALTSAI